MDEREVVHQRLPFDICRCHGDKCEVAESCLRHLQRYDIGERTPIALSLHREDETKCSSQITVNPGEWVVWHGGRKPVQDETFVEVKYAVEGDGTDTRGKARHFSWAHHNYDYYINIIAFRVVPRESEDI